MIARVWRGTARPGEGAEAYLAHLVSAVLPGLERIAGHHGADVLRRDVPDGIEFVVTTFWDSMEAVRAFAGEQPDRAVVEPDARALLAEWDDTVRHFKVVRHTVRRGG